MAGAGIEDLMNGGAPQQPPMPMRGPARPTNSVGGYRVNARNLGSLLGRQPAPEGY